MRIKKISVGKYTRSGTFLIVSDALGGFISARWIYLRHKLFASTITASVIVKTITLEITKLAWFKPCIAGLIDKATTRSNPKSEGLATHIFFSRLSFYETLGSQPVNYLVLVSLITSAKAYHECIIYAHYTVTSCSHETERLAL